MSQFLEKVTDNSDYDFIFIDCPPTESILTTAAYRASDYVFVPVKPEFLATIGLPLLARSIEDFRAMCPNKTLEMGGIIFNGTRRTNTPPEQITAIEDVKKIAREYNWKVFENHAYHSDSYLKGSRDGSPIFLTDYAKEYVKDEFKIIGDEFIQRNFELMGLEDEED